GSSVYLQKGDKYTVEDLLYGLMLRSGNDCAETLAVSLSGSIENFVSLMNKTALKYGAENTNFTNPHGLPSEGHYTTAADLCKIACAAMKNPTLKKIVGTKRHTATELNEGKKTLWVNKNKLLSSFEGATGIKTGYTVRAGRCLVFSAERMGMEVVGVVLDSPQMFERAKELMSDAFRDYSLVKIVDKDRFDYVLPLKNGEGVLPLKIEESFVYPVRSNEKIDAEIRLGDFAENYMSSGEKAGEIKIYCDKKLIFSENISIR
ncbi:MAG: D-alanyl-D-alanine carboxypeptidase, partial [Clostridia bacterium]|nr:D-alanyl-D-alanine carboxypeptidase [Clostridia bacterium]